MSMPFAFHFITIIIFSPPTSCFSQYLVFSTSQRGCRKSTTKIQYAIMKVSDVFSLISSIHNSAAILV